MKILAITGLNPDKPNAVSPVGLWRIIRPLRELARHMPDWQVDEQETFIAGIEKYKSAEEFTNLELEQAAKTLGKYDIVYSTYFSNRTQYVLMKVVHDRYGTEFVLDMDDDYFNINPDNPVWLRLKQSEVEDVWRMVEDCAWMTTTCDRLAATLRHHRPTKKADSVGVTPNYITDAFVHPEFDNGDKVVVGYMGGTSHWADVHDSGFAKALAKITRAHKNVNVRAIAFPIDIPIAESRMSFVDPVSGLGYVTDVFPQFKCDIMVGPLLDNAFNLTKSNIKWQEATRAGAMFIASNIGPYHDTLVNGVNALLVPNTVRGWYDALEWAITQPEARKVVLQRAQESLAGYWRLEDHWPVYRDFFQHVYDTKSPRQESKPKPRILTK